MIHRVTALALCLVYLSLAAASAQDTPAATCRGFFQAVADQQYDTAWKLMTTKSQDTIVQTVAKAEKLTPQKVRELFDKNDPSVKGGFWDSFRTTSSADKFAALKYTEQPPTGDKCTVLAGVPDSPRTIKMLMFRQNGHWRFGFIETFPPDK